MKTWNILYRGSLSSCNYECDYCPFAKTTNTRAELQQDELEVERFVSWVAAQKTRIGLLFTPWGEALVQRYYRRALVTLSRLDHVNRVAIQTNLSAPLDDLLNCNRSTLALWATFHPSQTTLERFLTRCHELDAAEIRYSVGVVGVREHFTAIEQLRRSLRPDVYLWINAFKRQTDYYTPAETDRLSRIDPYFHWNLQTYRSAGQSCSAGETAFAVDGGGHIRRCHFIKDVIGNIYQDNFQGGLKPRVCSAANCGCYIGYIHRPELRLQELYVTGLLERIPARWPDTQKDFLPKGAEEVTQS